MYLSIGPKTYNVNNCFIYKLPRGDKSKFVWMYYVHDYQMKLVAKKPIKMLGEYVVICNDNTKFNRYKNCVWLDIM